MEDWAASVPIGSRWAPSRERSPRVPRHSRSLTVVLRRHPAALSATHSFGAPAVREWHASLRVGLEEDPGVAVARPGEAHLTGRRARIPGGAAWKRFRPTSLWNRSVSSS